MSGLILSLFPGIDLLGRGFEAEGFTVVRGPDKLWGGDIHSFIPPPHRFEGVIAGSPCQDFSRARRAAPTGEGLELLDEFARVVIAARPGWWLLENVPGVPDVSVPGYHMQRLDYNAREAGASQRRARHFQFGSLAGLILTPQRQIINHLPSQPTALATEASRKGRRGWADFCEAQGLPRDFTLPALSLHERYKAVGNGVHVEVARVMARAILEAQTRTGKVRVCECLCGRIVSGRKRLATPACRKRMERRRKR